MYREKYRKRLKAYEDNVVNMVSVQSGSCHSPRPPTSPVSPAVANPSPASGQLTPNMPVINLFIDSKDVRNSHIMRVEDDEKEVDLRKIEGDQTKIDDEIFKDDDVAGNDNQNEENVEVKEVAEGDKITTGGLSWDNYQDNQMSHAVIPSVQQRPSMLDKLV